MLSCSFQIHVLIFWFLKTIFCTNPFVIVQLNSSCSLLQMLKTVLFFSTLQRWLRQAMQETSQTGSNGSNSPVCNGGASPVMPQGVSPAVSPNSNSMGMSLCVIFSFHVTLLRFLSV